MALEDIGNIIGQVGQGISTASDLLGLIIGEKPKENTVNQAVGGSVQPDVNTAPSVTNIPQNVPAKVTSDGLPGWVWPVAIGGAVLLLAVVVVVKRK